jgi:hypothetical protein
MAAMADHILSSETTAGKILDALGCRKDTTSSGFSVANMFYDTANACDPTARTDPCPGDLTLTNLCQSFSKALDQGRRRPLSAALNQLGNNSLDWKAGLSLMIEPGWQVR